MKEYNILKDFKGSQNHHDHHQFKAGTVAELSDSLAEVALKAGFACEIEQPTESDEPEEATDSDESDDDKAKASPANKMKKVPENKGKK